MADHDDVMLADDFIVDAESAAAPEIAPDAAPAEPRVVTHEANPAARPTVAAAAPAAAPAVATETQRPTVAPAPEARRWLTAAVPGRMLIWASVSENFDPLSTLTVLVDASQPAGSTSGSPSGTSSASGTAETTPPVTDASSNAAPDATSDAVPDAPAAAAPAEATPDAVSIDAPSQPAAPEEEDDGYVPRGPVTLDNTGDLSSTKASTVSAFDLSYTLQRPQSTDLVVTFPAGFYLNQAFTAGTCAGGGTIGPFWIDGLTIRANKDDCVGVVSLTGALVTNPREPGLYVIRWKNDDEGEIAIYISESDEVTITAEVDPVITFDIDTSLDGDESDAPYLVELGVLTLIDVRVSGLSHSVNRIVIEAYTNASSGLVVTVKNANGANGLKSLSVPADDVGSADGTMAAGTENYGLCVTTTGLTGFSRAAPYNSGACALDGATNAVQGLTTSGESILSAAGPVDGHADIVVNAANASVTAAHSDYQDTLTFIATATF